MQSYRWKFPLIAFLTAIFLFFYATFGITLGLDLKGGSVLVYDLVGKLGPKTREDTITILNKRLDTLGTKEMTLRPAGDRQIMVQLPGVGEQSKEKIKDLIARAGQLAFKIVVPRGDDRYEERLIRDIEDRKSRGEYEEKNDDFDTARLARSEGGETILVQNEGMVPGVLLEGASFTRDGMGRPSVSFHMKKQGTARLANTTEKYKGKMMAIILDGVAVSAPNINEPITGGDGIITGTFTQQEVDNLITVLRSGALPAKPVLASENTVEPTLGQASITRGMYVMYAAVMVVVVFMFVFYRTSGGIANAALILNVLYLLGIMSLFDFTLTLPGIAGIVLTIGMAVDANILIYERMREEQHRGVPLAEVIDAGYSHAFWAIFDSHVTTILSSVILYYVGTGPIRGFAVTLAIGIAVSLFTSLVVTRALFDFTVGKGILKQINMIQIRKEVSKFPFITRRMPVVIALVLLFNAGFLSFVVRGDQKYGIDFNGGSVVQIVLTRPMTKATIEERLAAIERPGPEGPIHPYASAEVTRMGSAEDPKTGAGRQFHVLVSSAVTTGASGGRKTSMAPEGSSSTVAHADEKLAAAGASVATAASGASAEPATEARTLTEQDLFLIDLEASFKEELAPAAFGPRQTSECEPPLPEMVRMTIEARLADGKKLDVEDAKKRLAAEGLADVEITPSADGRTMTIRTGPIPRNVNALDGVEHRIKSVLEKQLPGTLSNPFPYKASIGASVAENLKYRAVLAIVLSLIMIVVYLAFRFEPKMGFASALCLFHDVLVTLGFMMILDLTSKWTGIDAKHDLQTIAAYLTIVGYSINDKIVTFDRMRENLAKWDPKASKESYIEVLERSLNETFGRTLLTGFTVILNLIVLSLSGIRSLQAFTLALLCGIIFGTISSIMLAPSILLVKPRKLAIIVAIEAAFLVGATIAGSFLKL